MKFFTSLTIPIIASIILTSCSLFPSQKIMNDSSKTPFLKGEKNISGTQGDL